jgi:hypothetical protein
MGDEPDPTESLKVELTEALLEIARLQTQITQPRVADELLLLFGKVAALLLLISISLTAVLAIFRPTMDISGLASLLDTQLSLIIGAVLGWAAHPGGDGR